MKAYGENGCVDHVFLNSTLAGGERSTSLPGRFSLEDREEAGGPQNWTNDSLYMYCSLDLASSNWFFMTPSIATKFQHVNSFYFLSCSLHVSAPTFHPHVRYTRIISYFNELFLIQRIRCTYAI
jgi:hypothetical protein